jgi:HK97 gp10 family phage protein
MAIRSALNIDGLVELMTKLKKFPVAIRTALRRTARKVGGQVAKVAKAKAPNRKETMRVGDQLVRMYGASQALKKSIGVTITIKPAKYAHLVENGFTAKIWASNKRIRVSPKPFLRPALDSNSGQVSDITVDYLQMAIDDLIAKGKISPDMGSDT